MPIEYIDLQSHFGSPRACDYQRIATTGCRMLISPVTCFKRTDRPWEPLGDQLAAVLYIEPRRAAGSGVRHLTWLELGGMDRFDAPREAAALEKLVAFMKHPNVVGASMRLAGNCARELERSTLAQLQIVAASGQLLLLEAPGFIDSAGRAAALEELLDGIGFDRGKVLVNNVEERPALRLVEHGFWCGLELRAYGHISHERMVDIIELQGTARLCITTRSHENKLGMPMVPAFVRAMQRRGHSPEIIRQMVFGNPLEFLTQSCKGMLLN